MVKLQVKQDVFDNMGTGAGLVLDAAPTIDTVTNEITITNSTIIGATRGGITINANPTTRSRAVDGLASNTKGAHIVDRYEPTFSATFITEEPYILLRACGFGDIDANNIMTMRHNVDTSTGSTDYIDLYVVETRTDGGANIYHLKNATCTAGANIKTNHEGETEIPLTFIGNYDLEDQNTVPFDMQIVPAPVDAQPSTDQTEQAAQ